MTQTTTPSTWQPRRNGRVFRAVHAALLKRGLRLWMAANEQERRRVATYWLAQDGASRDAVLAKARTLAALCEWARCPLPPELNREETRHESA